MSNGREYHLHNFTCPFVLYSLFFEFYSSPTFTWSFRPECFYESCAYCYYSRSGVSKSNTSYCLRRSYSYFWRSYSYFWNVYSYLWSFSWDISCDFLWTILWTTVCTKLFTLWVRVLTTCLLPELWLCSPK